ncbi:MAG: M28 family peptidase [Anaerolineales bacterium]
MSSEDYAAKAAEYLGVLCSVKPNRRTGSPGNWEATEFFGRTISPFGYQKDSTPFEALDHLDHGSVLTINTDGFDVYTSPYSIGCDVLGELIIVSTIEELESSDCNGNILLLIGSICSEQLMPKNFVFYNPEHHQKIIALLEGKSPAAIITATKKSSDQVGALNPFPLIVDGDFDIPSVYCRESVGESLSEFHGNRARLEIRARRLPAKATNVIASLQSGFPRKIVLTAHIDAYEDTPGASDNASGTVVLLLAAEMLSNYRGEYCIEIAALNGEDHYSAGGQMDYLRRYGDEFPITYLAINIDDVGYKKGRSAYSFYGCPRDIEENAIKAFNDIKGLCKGEQWFNGDHMIFVQNQVPCIAFTAEQMPELMETITHTAKDTPDIIDFKKLVEVAKSLDNLIRSL